MDFHISLLWLKNYSFWCWKSFSEKETMLFFKRRLEHILLTGGFKGSTKQILWRQQDSKGIQKFRISQAIFIHKLFKLDNILTQPISLLWNEDSFYFLFLVEAYWLFQVKQLPQCKPMGDVTLVSSFLCMLHNQYDEEGGAAFSLHFASEKSLVWRMGLNSTILIVHKMFFHFCQI